MNNCKEISREVIAITAIPVSDVSASETYSVVNKLTPTIGSDDFDAVPFDNAITIGRKRVTDGGFLIPIVKQTGKATDEPSDGVAGRLRTVSVSCEIDERGGELLEEVPELDNTSCFLRLERVPHHLLLTFRDGSRGFASATEDTYLCTIDRSSAKVSVQFRIQNLMGIQMIISESY